MTDDLAGLLRLAESAVEHARSTRRYHARRTDKGSPQRRTDIDVALDRIRAAMKPLRAEIARMPFKPYDEEVAGRMRAASNALQRERRKLWKMLDHRKDPT